MAFTTLEARLLIIDDAIDSRIASRVESAQVAESSYTMMSLEDLYMARRETLAEIARQRSGNTGGRVLVNFRRAGRA